MYQQYQPQPQPAPGLLPYYPFAVLGSIEHRNSVLSLLRSATVAQLFTSSALQECNVPAALHQCGHRRQLWQLE